jgi:pyruvate dehydrogenase E2 component (dihydrolipoamide acetyltransferase)
MEEMTLALINITTPDLGGATDVTVIEVLVKPGDTIEANASIVTLESDKATMEVPSDKAGMVKEVKVKVGDKISSGSVLLTLESEKAVEKKETDTAEKPAKAEKKAPAKSSSEKKPSSEKKSSAKQTVSDRSEQTVLVGDVESTADVHAGPGVRRFARELGVNIAKVTGSGPKQRVLKEDVQGFVKNQLSQLQNSSALTTLPTLPAVDFSKFGEIETQALSRIKKISGKHLQRTWMMVPQVTQFGEADITELENFRQSQKEQLEKQKIKITPLAFVMKAAAASLKIFPHFNASLDASGENLILKKYIHIGVAVDTPDGLVVPVLRDVDKKGLIDLARELAHVSEKARNKQLTPGDMQGGCFSISSLGGIGGTAFTPIVNAPEVAILGVSKSSYRPVYQEGAFVPRLMLPLALSYDHRVIDGADGARFMTHLALMLSDIRNLLL